MAVTNPRDVAPRWPAKIDPAVVDLHYEPSVDELTLYFDGRPVPAYSDAIDAPDGDDVMIMIGMNDDETGTGEVVGIHVYPMAAGVLPTHPGWRPLTEPTPPHEAIAAFVAEVRDLFDRYWTPPPPIEEQLAHRPRPGPAGGGEGDG